MFKLIVFVALLAIAVQAKECQKDSCKDGKVCVGMVGPVPKCECPAGFKGDKCKERDCPIAKFEGTNFFGLINIDEKGLPKIAKVNALAAKCGVNVNVKKSFTRLNHLDDTYLDDDMAPFIGMGMDFELTDVKTKKLCDKRCLAGKPAKDSAFECFLSKMADKHVRPGRLQARAFSNKNAEDNALLKARQVGCALRTDLPQAPKSKLVGSWKLVGSENWEPFLKANNIGWWTRQALKVLKPDLFIENTGKDWVVSLKSSFKNKETKFTENKKFESVSPISESRTEHLAFSNGKDVLIEDQVIFSDPKREVHIIREVNEKDQLVQTMTLNGVVCKRIYGRKN